ncbi:MAG: hypothetical protein KY397_06595 [Gemmatimonadetes bacterium]|nr:hypothetical protein [Gemmatimonadota bacterium]
MTRVSGPRKTHWTNRSKASPVVSAGGSRRTRSAERPASTRPAPAYVDTIVSGLVAGHGLTEVAARAYLAARCA